MNDSHPSIPEARARADALRAQLRHFHAQVMPAGLRRKSEHHQVLDKADYALWMRLLQEQGWAIGHWPAAHGGRDWSLLERFAFEEELARLGCPWVIPFGVKYVGPVIYAYGSAAQQARFLPRIADGSDFWCQGYSEPGAGSDLAALKTVALRDGYRYRVSGQKVWTTYAQWADWMFCLVRTPRADRRPQQQISFLLVDLRSPGVSVRPIATMDGYRHVNEVWLDEVEVPLDQLVGAEGEGWTYAKYLLKNERTAGAIPGMVLHALARLRRAAVEAGRGADVALAHRIGELELRSIALRAMAYRGVEAMMASTDHGAEASLIKLRGTELYQDVAETLVDLLGPAGVAFDIDALHAASAPPLGPDDAGGIVKDHLYNRAATIFGGASEIQRNIVAKTALGL
ncbi:MAG: acyl-CoA dehydrogenase family protein [Burkholderiales bacterium]|nr:acyl-CoA dehydrogenase family protein [Burkholderiales bacterium]MDE1927932.1 acyl-CoA dehydrogenase family protein [Burkholderiales bacterium]MDE2160919.1 acyl-CoA dehydrogenase family protein [Burkholderiales bacterium]MDE2505045.1 acyl-CoA dehydrogenase family protein [Burkholderiales bacterium]